MLSAHMVAGLKPQRIRDPVHNLIEFDTTQFEQVMWRVIQTRPFQRLRRIKQLGFSDLVYPGATHTRFAHSVGVFHVARLLMRLIERHIRSGHGGAFQDHQAQVALAAALVHDLGHGMFSHAFEGVGKKLGLKMARHEAVSDLLIRDSDVSEALGELGSGFANDVADVIKRGGPGNLYDAVVSSQFDADRLDYMQRDRLMTGVQNSGIDFTWLLKNLEVGTVESGVDEQQLPTVETFVLGPKARYAAETYVLSLFQLYPTIYYHKATRAAEKVFSALMTHLIRLARDGQSRKTGLPAKHPFIKFAKKPDSLENALALDDTVFWGALPLMAEADDSYIANYTRRLRERRLPKCIDIRERLIANIADSASGPSDAMSRRLERSMIHVRDELQARSEEDTQAIPRVLLDHDDRAPYKRFQESKGPLNQIRIRKADGRILDLADSSPVVAGIEKFYLFRAYVDESDTEARSMIDRMIERALRSHDDAE